MSEPLVVTISHNLGQQKAAERLKAGFGEISQTLEQYKITILDYTWDDNKARLSVKGLGQTVTVLADVEETLIRLEAQLPWVLRMFADKIKLAVEKRGTRLLEKQ